MERSQPGGPPSARRLDDVVLPGFHGPRRMKPVRSVSPPRLIGPPGGSLEKVGRPGGRASFPPMSSRAVCSQGGVMMPMALALASQLMVRGRGDPRPRSGRAAARRSVQRSPASAHDFGFSVVFITHRPSRLLEIRGTAIPLLRAGEDPSSGRSGSDFLENPRHA